MRIDNNVGANAVLRKGHIPLGNDIANRAFLSHSATHFITNHRFAKCANADFTEAVSFSIAVNITLVNITLLRCVIDATDVLIFDDFGGVVSVVLDWDDLSHNDIAILNKRIHWHNPALIQLVVIPELHPLRLGCVGVASDFLVAVDFLVLVLLRMINRGGEHPAVNGALIHENGVFLIVSRIRHNRDDEGRAGGDFRELNHLHEAGIHEGAVRVGEDIRGLVHTALVIRDIDADGLLAHCAV